MKTEANEVCKLTKNILKKYVYSKPEYNFPILFHCSYNIH